jgi:putative transcriptional regulator
MASFKKDENYDFLRFENQMEPAAGRLLVANPFLPDSNFKRSVILLTEHGEEGSVGFVLNKPIDLKLEDVVKDFPAFGGKLFYGGPVQLDTLHFVHRRPDLFDRTTQVTEEIYWGGNFDMLRILLQSEQLQPSDIRFFVGYAGWGEEQLKGELEQHSWVVTPATEEIIFEEDPEKLWQLTLQKMGETYAIMSNFPEDPRMN